VTDAGTHAPRNPATRAPRDRATRAPLYRDAFALCEWLVGRLGDDDRVLARAVCARGLALLEAVCLALKGRRREANIDIADEQLIALRIELRLAAAAGYLTEAQVVHAMQRADAIGSQLGGWLRSLGPV
jgi:hypothetical protein